MTTAEPKPRKFYGPMVLRDHLGLHEWQFIRAREAGLIPAPDRADGTWSADLVLTLTGRTDEFRAAVGAVPDVGAWKAAEYLAAKLNIPVDPHAVTELGVMGKLPEVGDYKGHALYCGRALESFDDFAALSEAATCGALLTADEASGWLHVRRVDFDHLVRAGLAEPWTWAQGQFRTVVNLFRVRDLMRLAESDAVDWAAVRATPKGRPSPLAALPDAPKGGGR